MDEHFIYWFRVRFWIPRDRGKELQMANTSKVNRRALSLVVWYLFVLVYLVWTRPPLLSRPSDRRQRNDSFSANSFWRNFRKQKVRTQLPSRDCVSCLPRAHNSWTSFTLFIIFLISAFYLTSAQLLFTASPWKRKVAIKVSIFLVGRHFLSNSDRIWINTFFIRAVSELYAKKQSADKGLFSIECHIGKPFPAHFFI